jgi:RNase P/RNase MRP subunit p29
VPASVPLEKLELIGLRAKVVATNHPGYASLEGRVVDETMGTLTLEVGGRDLVVPKAGQAFEFTLPDGGRQTLEGRSLAFRPEDRTRKARPSQGSANRSTR